MKVRFWGTRGSLPSPLRPEAVTEKIYRAILGLPNIDTKDPEAVRAYVQGLPALLRGTAGGNTPCVEVQAGGETLIIDAGTGIRNLGIELLKGPCGRGEGVLHLLISHLHWDHIQGFPMFRPAFVPGNRIFIYGVHDIAAAFEQQQLSPTWPVSLARMQAEKVFIPLEEGQTFSIGRARIRTILNTHPDDAYSYRIEDPHSALVYSSDSEYQQLDEASLQPYIDFFRSADALIFDAQYTLREAWQKIDWGHSSAMIGIDLARAARVKKIILFHHDPTYSDDDLVEIRSRTVDYQAQDLTRPFCEVMVAYEGFTLDLTPFGAVDLQFTPDGESAILTPIHTFDEYGVGQLEKQLARLFEQATSPIIDLSQVETLTTAGLQSLVSLHRRGPSAPTVLAAPSDSVRQIIELSGYLDYFVIYPSVQAALAGVQAREALNLPGQVVQGRYQIVGQLGEGRLGTVLEAIDVQTDRPVALKLLSPTFSEQTMDRLLCQAERIMALNHGNIVEVLALDRVGEHLFVVEELVAGETLQQFLEAHSGPLPRDQAMGIALDVARALEYAHSRGVIHGDLKLSNVLLTEEGVKLSGFGLGSLAQGHNLLDVPVLFLTANYLAPEQILGQPLDARTDLYALGVILYELLTGQAPFVGTDRQVLEGHLHASPRPPRELNPRLSLSYEHLVLKLLARNPNNRYASAQQARRILGSLLVDAEDVPGRGVSPLVGRERQLRSLQACWEEARAGRGQLAFITGESGIGKTSLAQRMSTQSEAPVQIIGRCQQRKGSPAYHLFTEVLRAYFATVPPEFFDEKVHHLLGDFFRLVPELSHMLPQLPTPPPLEPEQEQLRLMSSLTRFIKHAAQERPWFLILDDLQWVEPSSLEMLRYLCHHLPFMALFIVGTYRDAELEQGHPLRETLRTLSSYPSYLQFPLDRLDQAEVGLVLANIWRQVVPADLTQRIYQHTGGNPFYVEELARMLVDDGLVAMQEGEWHFPALDDVRLPPSVHEAVLSRISHLSQDTQELLRHAAVLGPIFEFDALREMSNLSEWQVLEHLDMALERQLVHEVPNDTLLGFRHAEIQRVLYAELSPLRQRMLHRLAGEVLERRARPEPERIAEELAHHFAEAGELERAVLYSVEAAYLAQAAYANETALMWYSRTLEMLDQFGPEAAFQVQSLRLSTHQYLGEVLVLMGRGDDALEHYASAWALFGPEPPSGNQARKLAALCRQTAEVYETRSEYDLALEWLGRGLAYLDEGESSIELARIYNVSGSIYVRKGDYRAALIQHERALDLARAVGLRQVEADSLRALGGPTWYMGDYVGARAYMEQAQPIFREIGDRRGEASILNNLGVVSQTQGDYAGARACYAQSLPIYREIGYLWGEGMTLNNLGIVSRFEGDYIGARTNYEQSLPIFCQIGDRWGEGLLLNNLGVLCLSEGDYAGARAYLEQSLQVRRGIGDRGGESETLAFMGLLFLRLDDVQLAQSHSQQARELAQELGDRPNLGYALTFLGHALVSQGMLSEAAAVYRQALEIRRDLGQHNMAIEPLAGLAQVFLAQGDLLQARALVEEILPELERDDRLAGTEGPFRVYLTCYRVLEAEDDSRAPNILAAAYRLLQEQADSIPDKAIRSTFLQGVAVHREIVELGRTYFL